MTSADDNLGIGIVITSHSTKTCCSENDHYNTNGLYNYMSHIGDYATLTATEQAEIVKKAQQGDEAARADMIESNLKLVVYFANRFRHLNVPFEDLIQEGNIGLIKAIDKFDCTRNVQFSTYAAYWIKVEMIRFIYDQGKNIRIPVHMLEKANKINRFKTSFEKNFGREPEVREIAQELNLSEKQVKNILAIQMTTVSLETPVGEKKNMLGEFIADEIHASPLAEVIDDTMRKDILEGLHILTEREASVVNLRFGLVDGQTHSLKEISKLYKLSRERIRQIEKRAIDKLREYAEKNEWSLYLQSA